MEEAAGGEELGVEQSGAGGSADEIVGEQGEFDIEERAFADAADDGGHAVSGVNVAARLRAVVTFQDNDWMMDSGRQRGQFGVDLKIAQGFADFVQGSDFLEAEGDALEMAFENGNAIAMSAEAEAGVNEACVVPFAKKFLRLAFHFFFFAADVGNDVGVDVHGSDAGITSAGNGLERDDEDFFEAEGVRERLQNEDEAGCRTIRIGDDEAGVVAAIFLLHANGFEVRSVDLGNKQRNVGIHAVILGIADDGISGAGEIFFRAAGDA